MSASLATLKTLKGALVSIGESGTKELSFRSFFWGEVKEGRVRDQIIAYTRGVGLGFWSGLKKNNGSKHG